MNATEAKRLLEVLRPGGADDADPRFVEALRLAQRDPELARLVEAQRQFDGLVAGRLKSVSAPADLKAAILATHPTVRPEFRPPARRLSWWPKLQPLQNWEKWRGWPVRPWQAGLAAAAAVLLLGTVAGVLATNQPIRFSELREELVREAWGGETHLEFKSTDLGQVQKWLAGQGITEAVSLPVGLREMRLHGCQIVPANGQRVPMLCLADGSKHLHLFIVSGEQFVGLPVMGSPDFEKYGAWKTAAWREGSNTYILSGLRTQAFVTKFRKAGRWTMSG